MSEYQYYEFQAVDRPLTAAEQQELRALSTRARITATTFVNSYEWGSFKGSPARLMERYFDLHLYLANWGSRCFCLRLPKKLVDRQLLNAFLGEVDIAELRASGADLILEIARDELEFEDFDDGSGWLAVLAPLRANILSGDLRIFYLLWLTAVEADVFEPDEPEPMQGIGPLSASLQAFAEFFRIDPDLFEAAAERSARSPDRDLSEREVELAVRGLTEGERTSFLSRLYRGDAHVGHELRARIARDRAPRPDPASCVARTVGELRALAGAIKKERNRVAEARAAAERERRVQETAQTRKLFLDALAARSEQAWRDVETDIERRSETSYDRAAQLLLDLRDLAITRGAVGDFGRRLADLRQRHARKERFLQRLRKLSLPSD
jgi:hypothetical protein